MASATVETVEAGTPFAGIVEKLNEADVVVFPSLLDMELRGHMESFYPLSATEAVIPGLLDRAYAGAQASTLWAMPFAVDPVVMLIKQDAVHATGDYHPPADWTKIVMITNVARTEPYHPQLVFDAEDAYSFSNAVAAYLLAMRVDQEKTGVPLEQPVTEMEKDDLVRSLLPGLMRFITGSDENQDLELPRVESIEAFLKSDAVLVFSRYSAYLKLNEEQKKLVYAVAVPSPNPHKVMLCHALAAAIPLACKNPVRSHELIRYILDHQEAIAEEQHYLPLHEETPGPLSILNHVLVLRDSAVRFEKEHLVQYLQGKIDYAEFNTHWQNGLFLVQTSA